ncbi:MAG: hypothetical protein BMS9Abin36_1963 [Gammaproteobacteria bacterium]|nr:MAG: hypothetical protein BMS9Abin36_1963 [Gammaproteobacteria bacterium]
MNKKHPWYGVILAMGLCTAEADAALINSSVLNFNPGEIVCPIGGTAPDNCTYGVRNVLGSWFAMDRSGNGKVGVDEKVALSASEGIRLGQTQDASGSHTGLPDGSELPGIDNPWNYFGNTGMHKTVSPIVISGGDDGTGDGIASLDFSGWTVTWNFIPAISMGSGANTMADNPEGIAVLNCSVDCSVGDTFILDYSATVPNDGTTSFGNVAYALHLEGQISAVPVPAAVWLLGSGLAALFSCGYRRVLHHHAQ